MTEILAVFRSRSQAADARSRLAKAGVFAALVNTPKEAGVGCGLSVKFSAESRGRAAAVIARGNYSAFYGYFSVNQARGKNFYNRIK